MLKRDVLLVLAPALCIGGIALGSILISNVSITPYFPTQFLRSMAEGAEEARKELGVDEEAASSTTAADDEPASSSTSTNPLPIAVGVGALQGRRPYMEDRHSISLGFGDPTSPHTHTRCFFGVYDGHGGEAASTWCKNKIHGNLRDRPEFPDRMEDAMREALLQTDQEFLRNSSITSLDDGSTVLFGVLEVATGDLWVANAGDSRGIISRRGIAVGLSEDHKPDRPDERERIQKAGGIVQQATLFGKHMGPFRVYTGRRTGGLAVSRGLGDAHLKNNDLVIAMPEIRHFKLTPTDEFLIFATDGLWDVFSNQQACDFVRKFYNAPGATRADPEEVADLLVTEAIRQGSLDNVTAMIVYFTDPAVFTGVEPDLSDVKDMDTSNKHEVLHHSV